MKIMLRGYYTIMKYKKDKLIRLQFFYPHIIIKKTEVFIGFNSVFRIAITKDYKGFGFELLGFGIGIDINTDSAILKGRINE